MSIHSDQQFLATLRRYLHEDDVKKIVDYSLQPEQNVNINRRTGRAIIGVPVTRPRRLLNAGSVRNYKSVLLKFARYKAKEIGREARVSEQLIKRYNDALVESHELKYQTILTNIRILNRYVVVPLTGMEMKRPRASDAKPRNNKPRLLHKEVLHTLRYIWENSKNKDHVYAMILIFYTGLRSIEVKALTYRDIMDGTTEEHVIITIRKSKNYSQRNVCLFKGAPMAFFHDYFIPYLETKMLTLISSHNGNVSEVNKFLNYHIFSQTSYQSTQKEFKAALGIITNYDKEILKGAGLHSIRSDYITRAVGLIFDRCGNPHVAEKTVASLVGHKNKGLIYSNYITLGSLDGGDKENDEMEYLERFHSGSSFVFNEQDERVKMALHQCLKKKSAPPKRHDVFKDVASGETVGKALSNVKKNHSNLNNIISIVDPVYVIP